MSENYLNNLIYTEYLHDVQILEDVTEIIREYVPKKDEEKAGLSKKFKEGAVVKQIKKTGKPKKEKQLNSLDAKKKVTKKVTRKKDVVADVKSKHDLLEFDYIRIGYTSEKMISKKSEAHFFNDWLDLLNKEKLSHIDKNEKEKVRKKNKGSNHLIDEFIESNPKIVAVKENKNDKDFSAESVEEKIELFTETLAKIYIKQKAYEKAISAYEKLSLKYPEKIAYFADQIKNIKNISNN